MTINQLRKRLDRLALSRAGSVGPNPTLAAQWNNSTAGRLHELHRKTEPLTRDEHLERAHLEACQDAWRRTHRRNDVERPGHMDALIELFDFIFRRDSLDERQRAVDGDLGNAGVGQPSRALKLEERSIDKIA